LPASIVIDRDRVGKVQFSELQKPRDLNLGSGHRTHSRASIYIPNVIEIGKTLFWME